MKKNSAAPVGKLCVGHLHGWAHGAPRPYTAACPRCRELRGHLPVGERSRPASADFKDRKASRGIWMFGKNRRAVT